MSSKTTSKFCEQCGLSDSYHTFSWVHALAEISLMPFSAFSFSPFKPFERTVAKLLDWLLVKLRLLEFVEVQVGSKGVTMRTEVLVRAANNRGLKVFGFRSKTGLLNYFQLYRDDKFLMEFEGLPVLPTKLPRGFEPDDKISAKKFLEKNGFSVLKGRTFWWFQLNKAWQYAQNLGVKLVLKPRFGSFSRHVFLDVENKEEFKRAFKSIALFGPSCLVEESVTDLKVFRVTVVGGDKVAVVERRVASIVGDGVSTVSELILNENLDVRRGELDDENCILYKIPLNADLETLLVEQGLKMDSVVLSDKNVKLQKYPFVRLGATCVDVTDLLHESVREMACSLAICTKMSLVGMDLVCEDISRPLTEQRWYILELNSLPCIEIHYDPQGGQTRPVADWILDLVI